VARPGRIEHAFDSSSPDKALAAVFAAGVDGLDADQCLDTVRNLARVAAAVQARRAWLLARLAEVRSVGLLAVLERGEVDLYKARVMEELTHPLSAEAARAVEEKILPTAAERTGRGSARWSGARSSRSTRTAPGPGTSGPRSSGRWWHTRSGRHGPAHRHPRRTGGHRHLPAPGHPGPDVPRRTQHGPAPAALADYVRARDKTWRFPGCRKPAKQCDIDHLTPFPQGPTDQTNPGTLCRRHHRLKHTAGWTVTRGADGTFRWRSPTGKEYETRPEPYDDD